jgi:hypothetical protein
MLEINVRQVQAMSDFPESEKVYFLFTLLSVARAYCV